MPRAIVGSIERDDDLIGADQAEVLAHQLIGHVGIGLARVEQLRAVAQLCALLLDLGKLGLPLLQGAVVTANAGNAARRISSNRRFGPPFTLEENHERVGDASEKNDLVDEAGIKLWISPA